MKLIYRILLRLSLALLAVLTVWTVFFYFTMIDEINDEVDDALEDYSETIIIRSLAGKELPSKNDGSNNSYSIRPITREEARQYPAIEYYDADIYILSTTISSFICSGCLINFSLTSFSNAFGSFPPSIFM